MMMMIAFITFNTSLVPLIEGLCSSNPCKLIKFFCYWYFFAILYFLVTELELRDQRLAASVCMNVDLTAQLALSADALQVLTYKHTCMPTSIYTYTHTNIHTYTHT